MTAANCWPLDTEAGDDERSHDTTTEAQLEALLQRRALIPLGVQGNRPSSRAQYRKLIEAAPFVCDGDQRPEGLDCSPRGDPPASCALSTITTLASRIGRGNNRHRQLPQSGRDPRIALLFLIPGVGETIRINGRAKFRPIRS
jgi:hypothetical protein